MSREVTVDLLASSSVGLPLKFEALQPSVTLHPGELTMVRYRVVNTLGRTVTAHAAWNTAPARAVRWVEKTQCFCFTNQTFAPGETRDMPVVFRLKTDVPKDLGTIAFSYTFFEVPRQPS